MVEIRKISPRETYPLRKEVLRKGTTLPLEMAGDLDATTLHLGLFVNNDLQSIASFMFARHEALTGVQYQLRGMATAPGRQGRGYGRSLVIEAERRLKNMGVDTIWCNARVVALDFYAKLGYQRMGEMFDVPQIGPHYVMHKSL